MLITKERLEHALDELRSEVTTPRLGLWGPGTISWRVNREVIVFLAGGRAALLQLAHPFVAQAVDEHSATRDDPLGRFERTFRHVFAMAFGDLDHAIASSRRVHAIHERVQGTLDESVGPFSAGTSYDANDHDALTWVYATLIDSAVQAYELVVAALTRDQRERYYRESFRFAKLFGIDSERLPRDWDGFTQYNRHMHEWLAVSSAGRDIGRFLLRDTTLQPTILAKWYRLMTAGLLPEPLREPFGLPFDDAQSRRFDASLAALRRVYRHLPAKLRFQPTYLDALRRLEGKRGRDRWGVWMERHVLQAPIRS